MNKPACGGSDRPLRNRALFEMELNKAIYRARNALLANQNEDGYWCFELEADCTMPAEYILMMHFTGEIDHEIESGLAAYIRDHREAGGGWPLFVGGRFDISCSVRAYYALKLAGDSPDAPHMAEARAAILAAGGAAKSHVFTRITLALFEQLPWRSVPFIPVEIMLLPRWFPFHIDKVSYWSRAVMVPLFILCSLKPRAQNPRRVTIRELFPIPSEKERDFFPVRSLTNRLFVYLDRAGRVLELLIPKALRTVAIEKATDWFLDRANGTDGLGGILPAMVSAHEALCCLGYPPEHPDRRATKEALRKLIVSGDRTYCQPCVSPVWDTALSCLALSEEGSALSKDRIRLGLKWLQNQQIFDEPGDWRRNHPDLKGGGWAFQFNNPYYPDLDDTAVVSWALHESGDERFRVSIERAADWIEGMQSRNGGFAAFDSDNTRYYLNEIPFADHGALLDPPTADVSARCALILALLGRRGNELDACLSFLRYIQETDGSWFGRWGTNYIYGTWSVLIALEKVNDPLNQFQIERAVRWLKSKQRMDGSWGEDCESYVDKKLTGQGPCGTSFQTAWAMLGLMAAGEGRSHAVHRGAQYLVRTQEPNGSWKDAAFTAPGFPRVFYLKYHGYSQYFPFWALSRFRNIRRNV